jgi:hypothetical protein
MERVTCMVKIDNAYDVIIGYYTGLTLFERPSHKLKDSIEINI